MYAVVEEAAGARSREAGAERSTVRGHANDYNGGRTFAANDVPPPPEPQGMYPLCHHRVGPPPDFLALPFRCMQWSPVAVHTAASNGDRVISGWTEEWSCATCSATVAPSAMAPQGQQAACDGCGAWPVWVYDTHAAAGEWRCRRCQADVVFEASVSTGVGSDERPPAADASSVPPPVAASSPPPEIARPQPLEQRPPL